MAYKLKDSEKQFAEMIDNGTSQKEAYIKCFNVDLSKTTLNSIYSMASQLYNSDKIQYYITELHKQQEKQFANDINKHRIEMLTLIKERIDICKKNHDESNLTKYVNMLNRIYGLYNDTIDAETEKHDDIKQLSLEELKKLASLA